jgi:hypothetical protein
MNWQNYVVIGLALFNVVQSVRHHKISKAAFEKGLYNNRQLLGKTLSGIVSEFTHANIAPVVTAVEAEIPAPFTNIPAPITNVTVSVPSDINPSPAHAQAGFQIHE